jgi:predicted secreted hydrolase
MRFAITQTRKSTRRGALAAAGLAIAGCGPRAGDPRLLSEAPLRVQPAPTPAPAVFSPVRFPQDEGPHDVLAEWWYYTGHLYPGASGHGPGARGGEATAGEAEEEYGFELVFFRGVRGSRPPGYAAHFAITDLPSRRFRYDQRADVALNEPAAPGPAAGAAVGQRLAAGGGVEAEAGGSRPPGIVALVPPRGGFDLVLGGWQIRGRDGGDILAAAMPGYRLEVALTAQRPPALHLGDPPLLPGLISFGPAGFSYYYSRTRMATAGTLEVDGRPLPVYGDAWMDHQWGDFLVLGGGGWDWFAGTLRDGRDLTLSLVRDAAGATILAYGTLVNPSGEARHLPSVDFGVEPLGIWSSPHTGIRYPSGWRVRLPGEGLDTLWLPLLEDQELDARASSGVVYWEGAIAVLDAASRAELGRGYVELTGYAA